MKRFLHRSRFVCLALMGAFSLLTVSACNVQDDNKLSTSSDRAIGEIRSTESTPQPSAATSTAATVEPSAVSASSVDSKAPVADTETVKVAQGKDTASSSLKTEQKAADSEVIQTHADGVVTPNQTADLSSTQRLLLLLVCVLALGVAIMLGRNIYRSRKRKM